MGRSSHSQNEQLNILIHNACIHPKNCFTGYRVCLNVMDMVVSWIQHNSLTVTHIVCLHTYQLIPNLVVMMEDPSHI